MTTAETLKQRKRKIVNEYARPDNLRGGLQVVLTLVPLAALWFIVSLGPAHSYLWSMPATAGITVLLVRVFVLMHECGHGSLFANQGLNKSFGFVFGVLSGMPQYVWTQHHNFHHATNGNWDQYRGPLATLTRREFEDLDASKQSAYVRDRRVRMAPLAGLLYMIVNPRLNWMQGCLSLAAYCVAQKRLNPDRPVREIADGFETRHWASWPEFRHMTLNNLVLLGSWVLMSMWLGAALFFAVYLVSGALAGGVGIVLFTVQHNFEHAYASGNEGWDYDAAVLDGTSFLVLPAWLNWCTASIGYHHVHHLSARIPNYRLAQCHRANRDLFESVQRLHLKDVVSSLRNILWDQQAGRIISVAEHRALPLTA